MLMRDQAHFLEITRGIGINTGEPPGRVVSVAPVGAETAFYCVEAAKRSLLTVT